MALTDIEVRKYTEKLLFARMNLMVKNPFFGSLLMHVNLVLDERCQSAYTDMKNICFGVEFLEELSQEEVEFVLMHEVMHIALHHCKRGFELDQFLFNVACDIVVNSIIFESNGCSAESISLKKYGESLHKHPNGDEGAGYAAEEIYYALLKKADQYKALPVFTDDHEKWQDADDGSVESDLWCERIIEATKTAQRLGIGRFSACIPRFAADLVESKCSRSLDWKNIIQSFLSQELLDYSYNPPDRRFSDMDFFMPDFNVADYADRAEDVLFMIDTSSSVSDAELADAYSEISYALELFDERIKGWIGFFDAEVIDPVSFENYEDIKNIKPYGGGGTSFHCVFKFIKEKMQEKLPASIIIFTDGCAKFPDESAAMGIPVLWIISNDFINPPWGNIARIKR